MATTDYAALLATLEKVQQHDFTIFRLSESIATVPSKDTDSTRNSDVSAFDTSTPSALQADLSHYKVHLPPPTSHPPSPPQLHPTNTPQELFSKLRFSYLEQVTKEKFLRAITEDPPQIIEPSENDKLEHDLASAKSSLQRSKSDVDTILASLETLSRKLATEHVLIAQYTSEARTLPAETAAYEARVGELQREQESMVGEMQMPLDETLRVLGEREAELAGLERGLEEAGREVGRKRRVLEGLGREIAPLEVDREGLERFASEAVRMRGEERAEGRADRETMGRWYKAVFEGLEALLPKER